MRFGAANVACHTADEGKKENWASSPTVCKWFPKQRGTSEDWELERGDVGCPVDAHTKVLGYSDEGRHDGGGGEGRHAGMESDEDEVGDFLHSVVLVSVALDVARRRGWGLTFQ